MSDEKVPSVSELLQTISTQQRLLDQIANQRNVAMNLNAGMQLEIENLKEQLRRVPKLELVQQPAEKAS